jgi:GT2 family glycosyltransferase
MHRDLKINIYIPTYHRFEETKRSLTSILEAAYTSSFPGVNVFIGDNNSPMEMKDWLTGLARTDKVYVMLSKQNLGKPAMINYMYKQYPTCDYFISIDSDMVADENRQYNFIDEMVKVIDLNPEFGVISAFQKEHDCHLWDQGLTEKKNFGSHVIRYGNYQSVAGGCVILRNEDWKAVGGGYVVMGLYGYDDAHLMLYTKQKLNKECGILETVKLVHPYDKDKDYENWKKNNIHGVGWNVDVTKLKGFYDK